MMAIATTRGCGGSHCAAACRCLLLLLVSILCCITTKAFHMNSPSTRIINQRKSTTTSLHRASSCFTDDNNMRRSSSMHMLVPLAVPKDIRQRIKVGDIVIPVARVLVQPRQLVALGLYVGVEYKVLGIAVREEMQIEREVDTGEMMTMIKRKGEGESTIRSIRSLESVGVEDLNRVLVTLRPLYRLTTRFERQWPINVAYSDLPTLLSPSMYNAATLAASLTVSATFLSVGLVGRSFLSLLYVPSQSMYPSIEARDTLIVEGVSRFFTAPHRGDIIAFRPPKALQELVAARSEGATQGMPLSGSELFVKRVECIQGDRVHLEKERLLCETPQGELLEPQGTSTTTPSQAIVAAVGGDDSMLLPQEVTLPEGMSYVVGDNPSVSIDSRIWGGVPQDKIVGRVVWRLLPFSRFGPVE